MIIANEKILQDIPEAFMIFDYLILDDYLSYYFSYFDIFRKLLPTLNLDPIIADFIKVYEALNQSTHFCEHGEGAESTLAIKEESLSPGLPSVSLSLLGGMKRFLKINKWYVAAVLVVLTVSGGIRLWTQGVQDIQTHITHSIRSDLIIPTESTFLDRPELLAQIDHRFKEKKGIKAVALVGLGGVGKTTLARQYAQQQKGVVWEINAETHGTLVRSFEKLAEALSKTEDDKKILREYQEIKNSTEKEEKIIQFVKERLKTHPNWVLLFDNVEKFSDIQRYFPQDFVTWGEGKIILTTRDSTIQNNKHINEMIQIGELTSEQKLNLFSKIMNQEKTSSFTPSQMIETTVFLEKVPPFPLDVSVAAFYLNATNIPYETYLENLMTYGQDFEKVQKNLLKEAGDYTKTRYGIITLSLQKLLNIHKDFADLLLFVNLLDSQDIPVDLLKQYKNNHIVENFIYTLKKYSLITSEDHLTPNISIHRSTQEISLTYLTKILDLKNNQGVLHEITNVLKKNMADVGDKFDYSRMKFLRSHGEKFLSHSDLLSNASKAAVASELGTVHLYLSNFEKAQFLLEESIAELKKLNNESYARILENLGNLYTNLGAYKKAQSMCEEALEIYKKNASKNYVGIARALAYLGNACKGLEDYKKTINFYMQSLEIYNKVLLKNYAGKGWVLERIGDVYQVLGDYKKAIDFYRQSLEVFNKMLPKNHVRIGWLLTLMGSVYQELGDYKKAIDSLEQSFEIYEKYLSESHVYVGWASIFLGDTYRELGYYKKAKDLFEKSLKIHNKNFSETHPAVAWSLLSLGNAYKELGDYKKAKNLFEKSLILYRKIFPDSHIKVAVASGRLGSVYGDLGMYVTAINLLKKCLITYERHYGKSHIKTARILRDLGHVCYLKGSLEEAENFFTKAMDIFQNHSHPNLYMVFEDLAKLHLKKAEIETNKGYLQQSEIYGKKAIYYMSQALEIVKAHFPENSPHIDRIKKNLQNIK
ncbi:MAG: tetratricopeptide repeat protein [Flavobacteriales bacterium]|nr:tetratricopeptide repeat protein [Flavobacteriales bacterium]